VRYEPFTSAMADPIIQLWNKELAETFPLTKELFDQNTIHDENLFSAGSYVCLEDVTGAVVGIILTKVWQQEAGRELFSQQTGWIQVFLVDQRYRGCGIGSTLLSLAETALREKGINRIVLGTDYLHYFPGIPEQDAGAQQWFERKGYQPGSREVDLAGHFEEPIPLADEPGVTYTILEQGQADELISFLHRCFPGRWEYEAIDYFARGGTGREFVVLRKQGQIKGFCRVNDPASPFIAQNVYWSPLFEAPLGGIGPLGIDEDERGHGYGLAVVKAGVNTLVQRGIKDMVIDWTGLIDFYQKLGFTVWKSYQRYSKDLV
jgi:GNAT superfamily N-acetyltransferase